MAMDALILTSLIVFSYAVILLVVHQTIMNEHEILDIGCFRKVRSWNYEFKKGGNYVMCMAKKVRVIRLFFVVEGAQVFRRYFRRFKADQDGRLNGCEWDEHDSAATWAVYPESTVKLIKEIWEEEQGHPTMLGVKFKTFPKLYSEEVGRAI